MPQCMLDVGYDTPTRRQVQRVDALYTGTLPTVHRPRSFFPKKMTSAKARRYGLKRRSAVFSTCAAAMPRARKIADPAPQLMINECHDKSTVRTSCASASDAYEREARKFSAQREHGQFIKGNPPTVNALRCGLNGILYELSLRILHTTQTESPLAPIPHLRLSLISSI